jgi:hypothetical protein
MQLRPDELPDMTQDEVRAVTLNLASIAGANTVSAPSATCDTLTIGTPSIDGKDMTFTVTADQTGTHYILVSADLANKPDQYLKVIASLLPRDVNLNLTDGLSELSDEAIIDEIRKLHASLAPFLAEGNGTPAIAGKPAQLH